MSFHFVKYFRDVELNVIDIYLSMADEKLIFCLVLLFNQIQNFNAFLINDTISLFISSIFGLDNSNVRFS